MTKNNFTFFLVKESNKTGEPTQQSDIKKGYMSHDEALEDFKKNFKVWPSTHGIYSREHLIRNGLNPDTSFKRRAYLEPDNMKVLGFDCTKDDGTYLNYRNNGKVHNNVDYNKECPESRGRVLLTVNFEYSDHPFICIEQDGGTRKVYYGVCRTEEFLKELITSVR